jgi:hypothetical protein
MAETFKSISSNLRSSVSLLKTCEKAFGLMKDGKESEAKDIFPLEYYLIKKYLYLNLEDFTAQLEDKLNLQS